MDLLNNNNKKKLKKKKNQYKNTVKDKKTNEVSMKRKTSDSEEWEIFNEKDTFTVGKKNEDKKSPKMKKLKNNKNVSTKSLNVVERDDSEEDQQSGIEDEAVDSSEELVHPKQLHRAKKDAISTLNELRDILGVTKNLNAKEKELEEFIFGCDSEDGLQEFEDSASDSHSDEEKEENQEEKKVKKPSWQDEDDEEITVGEKASTLENCHKSMASRAKDKYSSYIQESFKKFVGDASWAELGRKASSDDDSDNELLQKTGDFVQASQTLPKGTIKMQKCPSLVDEGRNNIVKCVEFHPAARVAVVAGTNGNANLFQIDGKINAKIQSVHFENFPVYSAHFTLNGNEIIVSSKMFSHFFSYDMMSGKVLRIPYDKGMEQKSIHKFQMSPDGKYIVILGNFGFIHLITADSKEWVGRLKMNGEVRSITFNKDGSKMYSHGENGEVYIWDMNTKKCIHKFEDEGCVIGTSLALSPNDQFLVTGSDTGDVSIYDNNALLESQSPKPVKVLKNLTTEITDLKFNCTSELLAMSSSHKQNAVKLVHFPSMTVFSNFPVRADLSSLKYINSLDISVNSGYLCLGNNLSTVHLYRLKHYNNY